ncbi:hypothetical protein C1I89_33875, partial [Achromobacter pulmonis]
MLTGIRTSVVGALLPAVTEWAKRMGELGRANREAISQRILEGLREFWSMLRPIGNAVSWVAERVGGFGNLLGGVAAVMATRLIVSILLVVASLLKLGYTAVVVGARLTASFLGGLLSVSRGLVGLAARAIP